jgi:hypothetical protein
METIDETLEALAAGEIDVATARERLRGIDRIGEFARIDANYAARTGVPEIVWTAGKADDEAVAIARELVAETGLAILADAGPGLRDRLRDAPEPATVTLYDRSDTLVCRGPDRAEDGDRDDVRGGDGENGGTAQPAGAGAAGHGTVAVVTAGTSDVPVARRAEIIAREMGPAVDRPAERRGGDARGGGRGRGRGRPRGRARDSRRGHGRAPGDRAPRLDGDGDRGRGRGGAVRDAPVVCLSDDRQRRRRLRRRRAGGADRAVVGAGERRPKRPFEPRQDFFSGRSSSRS